MVLDWCHPLQPNAKHLGIYLRSYHGEATVITDAGEILRPAGVQAEDILLSVNGTSVDGAVHGCQLLSAVEAGKMIELVLQRKNGPDSKVESKEPNKDRKPIGHAKAFNNETATSTGSDETRPEGEQQDFFKGIGEWVGMVSKRILKEEPSQQEEVAKSRPT